MSTEDILREIEARFVSANSVPVERAMIKRIEWEAVKALLARLGMKVNAAACLLYGVPGDIPKLRNPYRPENTADVAPNTDSTAVTRRGE